MGGGGDGQTVGRTTPRPWSVVFPPAVRVLRNKSSVPIQRKLVAHHIRHKGECAKVVVFGNGGWSPRAAQGVPPWVSPFLCSPRHPRPWLRCRECAFYSPRPDTPPWARSERIAPTAHWPPDFPGNFSAIPMKRVVLLVFRTYGGCKGAKPPCKENLAKPRRSGRAWEGNFLPCATLGQRTPLGGVCGAQPATLK